MRAKRANPKTPTESRIGLDGYDATTLGQIGAYYFACAGAQLPALWTASFLIGMADFRHPLHIACFVTLGLQGVLFAIRALMWRWSIVPGLNQSIPLLAGLAYVALLLGHTVLFTWLVTGPRARFLRR